MMRRTGEAVMSRSFVLLAAIPLAACASPSAADDPSSAGVIGPVTFRCDDGSVIEATFDNTPDPATVQLVRGDQTGSVRILRPATWMSSEACPTMVTRSPSPSIRSSGFAAGNGLGDRFGQATRPPPNCQRNRSRNPAGTTPFGLKK